MKKLIKKLLREGLLNESDFNQGGCNLYAVALHRKYNLPIYTIRGYFREEEWEEVESYGGEWGYDYEDSHVVVKLPNGKFLDSDGTELTKDELLKQVHWSRPSTIEKVDFVEVTDKEACNLYYGQDEQDEIKPEDEDEVERITNEYL